jgi:hypothetical protein
MPELEPPSSGLLVFSNGAITVNSITAISNVNGGVILDNSTAVGNKPVTFTGSNEVKFNSAGGALWITSNGAVTLHNITSSGNTGGDGLYVNNTTSGTGTPQNVTVTGYGNFNNNTVGSGLRIFTYGAITLTGIAADGNGDFGAWLNNRGDGSIDFAHGYATLPRAVTITGTPDSDFMNNQNEGLFINSLGAITVSGVEADYNHGNGATLNNDFTGAVGGITFGGWGDDFSYNTGYGLNATTQGAITSGGSGLSAWNNTSYGAFLDNHDALIPKAVTLNGSPGNSYGYNTGGNGLTVNSLGVITLNNPGAYSNSGAGISLGNNYSGAVGSITLTGSSVFHDNGGDGLDATSTGTITLNSVDATNNDYGVYLDGGNITINGSNGFNDNRDHGLGVSSTGNILLHNVDVWNNGTDQIAALGSGAHLGAIGNVTVTGYGSFHENFNTGLEVFSSGTVILNNIYAANNGIDNGVDPVNGYGVYVDNSFPGGPKAVVLKGNNSFDNNYSGDLFIRSKGAISLSNLDANDSANGYGAQLNNSYSGSGSPQNVTITGYGNFNNNYLDSLNVSTFGTITLSNIIANDSHTGSGVYLDNSTGKTAKAVTINGFSMTDNNSAGYGLFIKSLGAITVANLYSGTNEWGAYLDNCIKVAGVCTSPVPAAVKITGGANTSDNTDYGMQVQSKGAITVALDDGYISGNGGYGWFLDNHIPGSVGGVTLSTNAFNNLDFNDNALYGLLVQTLGSIKITNLDALNNHSGAGATLNNAYSGSVGTVTLLTTEGDNGFNNNSEDGLDVTSNRSITITGLHTDLNGGAGAMLNNTSSLSSSPQNVTLLGHSSFTNNGDDGLYISAYGTITLNGVDASSNGNDGAYLDNCGYTIGCTGAVTPKAITLNGTNSFYLNTSYGLWATSLGAIKVNAVTANNNFRGAWLDNQWALAVGGITITSATPISPNNFSNNLNIGLYAHSNGALTLSNIWATGNTYAGASLDNCNISGSGCTVASGNVTLTGRNRFTYNGDFVNLPHSSYGLMVSSKGAITISNLVATGNDGIGAILDNCAFDGAGCTATGNLTLTGTNDFSGNYSDGLDFHSGGNVSLTRVTSDLSTNGYGVFGIAHGTITVTCGSFNNNFGTGLYLSSPATMTLIHVIATGNSPDISTGGGGSTIIVPTCPLP